MSTWRPGLRVKGVAAELLPGGEVVVRAGGASVLVRGGLPGEELEISLTGKRRGAWRGRLVRVLQASDWRTVPLCSVAGRCGGCALQHCDPAGQSTWKSRWVRKAFDPWIQSSTEWIPCSPIHAGVRRRRVRWHVGHDDHGRYLGFRVYAGHQVIRQSECPAVSPELVDLRRSIESRVPGGVKSVQATALHDGIHLIWESDQPVEPLDDLEVNQWWRHANGTHPLGEVRTLHDCLPAGKQWIRLAIGPDAFVQGERSGNVELVSQIQAWLPDDCRLIVDLFCGAGNLSLPAAVVTNAELIGAEINANSLRDAEYNARRLNVRARFLEANLFGAFNTEPFAGADVMILDPPRKGCRQVCRMLPTMMPRRVILISCDSASAARDAALLHEAGYRLHAVRALDLFPWSGHVEAMSLWLPV